MSYEGCKKSPLGIEEALDLVIVGIILMESQIVIGGHAPSREANQSRENLIKKLDSYNGLREQRRQEK